MDYENILFLDIDGVVNTVMIYDEPQEGSRSCIERDGYYFELCHPEDKKVSNKQAMLWVSKLCTDYDLAIVITSTWLANASYKEIAEYLYNSGLHRSVEVIGGIPTDFNSCRGVNIENWMKENNVHTYTHNIVILDDDVDMVGLDKDYSDYLIRCDNVVGFTQREYTKASELLDKQLDY